MKYLSQILRTLMGELQLSESELSRRAHVGQPVIHRILSGETDNPRVATLSRIANYFSISISQLIGDSPLPSSRLPGTHSPMACAWSQVPLLTWEQACRWPQQKNTILEPEMVATDLPVSVNAFALRVKDATMSPLFVEGMLLIIDPQHNAENRDYAIIQLPNANTAVFKQILVDGNDIYLKPLNPDFKTMQMDKLNSRIIGTIIQARSDFYKIKNLPEVS